MRLSLLIFIKVIIVQISFGQRVQTILRGNHSDSSFYHIARVDSNEFWAGGEYGILKSIDSLGNVKTVDYPNLGFDILKIEPVNGYIYIITDNATIYKYDKQSKVFIAKSFPKFRGKCFYDLIGLPNGQILVCGGTSGIAKGERVFPRGFIAVLDEDLNEIEVVWKSFRRFVWSLLSTNNEGILAVTFNGFKSRILQSDSMFRWEKKYKVNGLVHEIAMINDSIWYSGTKNIRFRKNGIWGRKENRKSPNVTDETGCLWSMQRVDNNILMSTYSGDILKLNTDSNTTELLPVSNGFSLYDIENVTDTRILVVGHGKGLYMIDFE